MFLKLAGAAVVAAGAAALGLYYAGLDGYRTEELLEFKKAFTILTSEIEYVSTPLPEAMSHIASRTAGTASAFFSDCATRLHAGEGETAYRMWVSAADAHKKTGGLAAEDWEVITSFGKTLGYLDKTMQLNAIRCTQDYIDDKITYLQENGEKNKRMYRSLGFLGGLLLAVVLW